MNGFGLLFSPRIQGVKRRMVLVVNFCRILKIINFCFVVAICDLVHDMQTIFRHP